MYEGSVRTDERMLRKTGIYPRQAGGLYKKESGNV